MSDSIRRKDKGEGELTAQATAESTGASSSSDRALDPTEIEYIDTEDLEDLMDQMGFTKDGNDRWELIEEYQEDEEDEEEEDETHQQDIQQQTVSDTSKGHGQNSNEFLEGSVGFLTLLLVLSMVGFLTITFVFVEKEWKEGGEGSRLLLAVLPMEGAALVYSWYYQKHGLVVATQVLAFAYKLRLPLLAVLMTVFLITVQACLAGIVIIKRKIKMQGVEKTGLEGDASEDLKVEPKSGGDSGSKLAPNSDF